MKIVSISEKIAKRPDMVAIAVNLYKIDKLVSTFEVLQEEMAKKYQRVYCEAWVELEILVDNTIMEISDCITPSEMDEIDLIQIKELEKELDEENDD